MQARQFERLVREASPAMPQEVVRAALDFCNRQGLTGKEDVKFCVDTATRILARGRRDESVALFLTPSLVTHSNQLAGALTARIEKVRETLFGSAKAPFSSLSAAARWVEETAQAQPSPTRASLEAGVKAQVEEALRLLTWSAKVTTASRSPGASATVGWKPSIQWGPKDLSYVGLDGEVRRVTVWPASSLAVLERACRELASTSRFSAESIVSYILAGVQPVLPPWAMSLRRYYDGSTNVERTWVNVEINSQDLTFDELRRLYLQIRSGLNVYRAKAVNKDDLLLGDLVQRLGGPPGKPGANQAPAKTFWERAQVSWNKEHPDGAVKTWRALEMRYVRLGKRLARTRRADAALPSATVEPAHSGGRKRRPPASPSEVPKPGDHHGGRVGDGKPRRS